MHTYNSPSFAVCLPIDNILSTAVFPLRLNKPSYTLSFLKTAPVLVSRQIRSMAHAIKKN